MYLWISTITVSICCVIFRRITSGETHKKGPNMKKSTATVSLQRLHVDMKSFSDSWIDFLEFTAQWRRECMRIKWKQAFSSLSLFTVQMEHRKKNQLFSFSLLHTIVTIPSFSVIHLKP